MCPKIRPRSKLISELIALLAEASHLEPADRAGFLIEAIDQVRADGRAFNEKHPFLILEARAEFEERLKK